MPILLVEDDRDTREAMEILLAHKGFRVEMAANGLEAIGRLRLPPPPRLVVLDLLMPHADGKRVLEEMQRDERTRGIPVLVASASLPDMKGISAPNIRGMFLKPFDWDRFLEAVDSFAAPG